MSASLPRTTDARGPGTLWVLAVAVLALAAGVSLATPLIANAQLRAALSRTLGTSDVRVQVSAWPPPALWWGQVDVLTVEAHRARVGTLTVEAFDATLNHVWFDPGALYTGRPFVVRTLGGGTARATVTQDALAALLNAQPSVRDAVVTLDAGRVSVAATVSTIGPPVRAKGDGRLVIRGGTAVDLVLDRVTAGGFTLQGGFARAVAQAINPVLDLREVPFGLHFTGVTVGGGKAMLDAVAGRE